MQPPTTALLCSAAFRATLPPHPASLPLHSEPPASSSLPLAEESADTDSAYMRGNLQSKQRYLHSQHFSNSVSSLNWPKMPAECLCILLDCLDPEKIPLFGWPKPMVWTTIPRTVTGAGHPLSADITQQVEWIQFCWPYLTHDTPLVLLWPGRHWNNIWKCWRGIRHRPGGRQALMNSDTRAAGTRTMLAVSPLHDMALSPEKVVRL